MSRKRILSIIAVGVFSFMACVGSIIIGFVQSDLGAMTSARPQLPNAKSVVINADRTFVLDQGDNVWATTRFGFSRYNGETVLNFESAAQIFNGSPTWDSSFLFETVYNAHGRFFGIDPAGNLYAWGNNANFQLGDGTNVLRANPVLVSERNAMPITEKIHTSTTGESIAYINRFGELWISGVYNGSGDEANANAFQIQGTWIDVAISGRTFYALDQFGYFWMWGDASDARAGDGYFRTGTTNIPNPIRVSTARSYKSISAGHNHVLLICSDDFLWGFGSNGHFNGLVLTPHNNHVATALGLGTSFIAPLVNDPRLHTISSRYQFAIEPIQIGTAKYKKAVAGNGNSFAIDTNGRLWVWGRNTNGELGLGDNIDRSIPTQSTIMSFTDINFCVASRVTVAIDINGRKHVTGQNIFGLGSDIIQFTAVTSSNTYAKAIYVDNNLIAVDTKGEIWKYTHFTIRERVTVAGENFKNIQLLGEDYIALAASGHIYQFGIDNSREFILIVDVKTLLQLGYENHSDLIVQIEKALSDINVSNFENAFAAIINELGNLHSQNDTLAQDLSKIIEENEGNKALVTLLTNQRNALQAEADFAQTTRTWLTRWASDLTATNSTHASVDEGIKRMLAELAELREEVERLAYYEEKYNEDPLSVGLIIGIGVLILGFVFMFMMQAKSIRRKREGAASGSDTSFDDEEEKPVGKGKGSRSRRTRQKKQKQTKVAKEKPIKEAQAPVKVKSKDDDDDWGKPKAIQRIELN